MSSVPPPAQVAFLGTLRDVLNSYQKMNPALASARIKDVLSFVFVQSLDGWQFYARLPINKSG